MLSSNDRASRSAAAKPSMRPIAIGKNVASAMTRIFGISPKPNQMMSSGAIAMMGSVWDTTNNGTSARLSHGEKSTATARIHATANETANPMIVT
jgi:hypothetical protein